MNEEQIIIRDYEITTVAGDKASIPSGNVYVTFDKTSLKEGEYLKIEETLSSESEGAFSYSMKEGAVVKLGSGENEVRIKLSLQRVTPNILQKLIHSGTFNLCIIEENKACFITKVNTDFSSSCANSVGLSSTLKLF